MNIPAPGQTTTIGSSIDGRDITLSTYGAQNKLAALLIGGVHGDETEGFLLVERFQQALAAGELQLDADVRLYVVPRLNPDGCAAVRRTNGRNVDLNRNLPTADWTGEFTNVRY